MHFVTGGAFNGKGNWVKEKYPEARWVSAYKGEAFLEEGEAPVIVLEGMEKWIKEGSFSRQEWRARMEKWQQWEWKDSARQVILIGTDISKGVVPIKKGHRQWRDLTGWVYQDIVELSEKVDVIWYGLNQTIKG